MARHSITKYVAMSLSFRNGNLKIKFRIKLLQYIG